MIAGIDTSIFICPLYRGDQNGVECSESIASMEDSWISKFRILSLNNSEVCIVGVINAWSEGYRFFRVFLWFSSTLLKYPSRKEKFSAFGPRNQAAIASWRDAASPGKLGERE